ncbi:MAG: ABC transporter permease [Parabacteroides sp.]
MKAICNIIEIWYHELTTVMRDKGILIFILFVPLAYPLLYSYVYTNEVVREVPAAVVDESQSALSREFIRKIDASPDVRIVARCGSMAEAEELLKRQEVYGIVRIPSTFTRDIWKGEQSYVGLYCDMCSMLYYKALMLTATNVSLEMNKEIKVTRYLPATTDRQAEITRMPIEYDYIPLYNPQSGFAAFLIPPVLMLIIQQTLFLGVGMSMGDSRERYRGSVIPFERSYKHPVHIVLGKSMLYFLLYLLMGIYMFTFVTRQFGLPQLGRYGTFLAFLVPYLLACIFMAMVLSAFVYRREDCIMLFVFLSVPLLFLSGISWPGSAMPTFWKYVSWLFPSTFGMNGYVRLQGMGASLADVAFEYRGLWMQAGIYFLMACAIYGREIRRLAKCGIRN